MIVRKIILIFLNISLSLLLASNIKGQSSINVSTLQDHPRLFLTDNTIDSVRTIIGTGRAHPARLLSDLIVSTADTIVSDGSPITYTFDSSGKRLLEQSRTAVRNILFCSYAYRLTGQNRYLDRALRDLKDVCSFPDWNANEHFLDAAEMSLAVSIGYDWLHNMIPGDLKQLILESLGQNVYQPSCDDAIAWFYDANSNWNQVCNACLSVSAVATYESTDTTSVRILSNAVRTNRRAVKSIYAEDGIYPEGPGYWSYGTSFECLLLSVLDDALAEDPGISDLSGFSRTGDYKLAMSRPSGLQYNYSDNIDVLRPSYPLWYFASRFRDRKYVKNEVELLKSGRYAEADEFRLLPLLLTYALDYDNWSDTDNQASFFKGNGDTPLVVVRLEDSSSYLGVKGGRAVNPHSHLDAGSFVYEYEGTPWSVDLSRQDYNSLEKVAASLGGDFWDMSQGSLRWELLRLNNLGHSTLTINGKAHNVKGKAVLLSSVESQSSRGGTFDLSALFEGQAARCLRMVVLNSDGSLTVTDTVAATDTTDAHVRWNMVTPAHARVEDSGITLQQGGRSIHLECQTSSPIYYKVFSSDPSDYPSRVSDIEDKNPGITFCGFEAVVPKGKTAVFTTVLKPLY